MPELATAIAKAETDARSRGLIKDGGDEWNAPAKIAVAQPLQASICSISGVLLIRPARSAEPSYVASSSGKNRSRSHPSVRGMADGTGTANSVDWRNSVRSMLHLSDPDKDDADARTLELKIRAPSCRAGQMKMPRLAQRFNETGHSWVWGHRTPAARSLPIRGGLKATPLHRGWRL